MSKKKTKKSSAKKTKKKPVKKAIVSAATRLSQVEKKRLDLFCNTQNWKEAGEFIDAETAGKGHKQWRADNLILQDPDDDIKNYTVVASYFSAKKLQELLAIQGCNGVRVYFCKSTGKIGDRHIKYRDLFLMPTTDGKDLFDIKPHVRKPGKPIPHKDDGSVDTNRGGDGILNSSIPCPDHCSKLY